MAVQRGLLLIADIAGYTRFMEFHRTDLAHAQDVVARLLEAMIDATSALDLVEVEGDAAFMYRPLPGGPGPRPLEEELEGVGRARTWYLDLAALAAPLPPRPEVTWLARQRETLGVVLRALPYALGLRKLGGLRNLTPA